MKCNTHGHKHKATPCIKCECEPEFIKDSPSCLSLLPTECKYNKKPYLIMECAENTAKFT